MVGVRYMHFCQQERAYYSANFDIKYALSRKLAVMHLCLPTLDMRETIISRTIIRAYARRAALAEPIIWVEVGSVYQLGLPGGSLQNTRHRLPYSQHTCIILSQWFDWSDQHFSFMDFLAAKLQITSTKSIYLAKSIANITRSESSDFLMADRNNSL